MTDKHQHPLLKSQPELQEAVVRLLLSLDEANLKLAVSLMDGQPSPPAIRAAFLVAAHLKRLAPRQQLLFKHQLRAHLPKGLQPAYDRLFRLHHPDDPYPGPNGLHIGSLTRLLEADPELDGMEVARIMFQGGDSRLRACALHYWMMSDGKERLFYLLAYLRENDFNYHLKTRRIKYYPRLNEAIDGFSRLDKIELAGNYQKLQHFPGLLADLVFLRKVSLTHHAFTSIPQDYAPLPHLTDLDLSHNCLADFPSALAQFDTLEKLNLSWQQVPWQAFEDDLSKLYRLKSLELAGNGLQTFPSALLSLPGLVKLGLAHNQLRHLPKEIQRLKKLQAIDLCGNPLETDLHELLSLPKLKLLYLDAEQALAINKGHFEQAGIKIIVGG